MRSILFIFAILLWQLPAVGQDDCLFSTEIQVTTSNWGAEISWDVSDFDGNILIEGSDYENDETYLASICLDSTCYVLNMYDSFGDGWNGASISFNLPELGLMIGEFTLESGNTSSVVLPWWNDCGEPIDGSVVGCTDPFASNYNPLATIDDGTCSYVFDCDCDNELYIPVCALDLSTGAFMVFDNLCLANCVGAIILSDGDCSEFEAAGCTDPLASNYNAAATEDDGSCTYACEDSVAAGLLYLCTFSEGQNVALTIANADGTILYEGNGFNNFAIVYQDVCLDDGCYTATLTNVAGDNSWYGGYFYINSGGAQIVYATLPDNTNEWSFDFSVDGTCGDVFGCTDEDAMNYNPLATVDDGSCMAPCVCDDVYEPVCGYDYYTGEMITFNNMCELACNGAYFYWEGDCSDQPVYGCMDEDALNFNPEATIDSGCYYQPVCANSEILELIIEPLYNDSLFGQGIGSDPYPSASFSIVLDNGTPWYATAQYLNDANQWVYLGCIEDGCYNFTVYSNNWTGEAGSILANWGDNSETFAVEVNDYTATYPLAINTEGCEVTIPGCTDPEAQNYNPIATSDNGSCYYPFVCDDGIVASLYVCTFSNGSDVALTITDDAGNVVYDQQGYSDFAIVYIDLCLDPSACYTATMSNIGNNTGWGNGYFYVNSLGMQLVYDTLEDTASTELVQFSLDGNCGDLLGCTDENAANYDPNATVDDGSCFEEVDCDGLITVSVLLNEVIWVEEVSWYFMDENGQSWLPGSGLESLGDSLSTGCLAAGCYDLVLEDSFGDGWNGNTLTVLWQNNTETFTIETGGIQTFTIGIDADCNDQPDAIVGCMDSGAINYNPAASEDDGSCEFTFCPTNEVTFVTVTPSTGLGMGWYLSNSEDSIPAVGGSSFAANSSQTQTACLTNGCYDITLFASDVNGWDGGWLEVWMNGELMETASMNSGWTSSMVFGLGTDCEGEGGDPGTGGSPFSFPDPISFAPYPNPTEEIVNINGSDFDAHLPISIDLFDITGKAVFSRTFIPFDDASGWAFNVSGWASGLYQIVGTQGKQQAAGRFLVH